MKRIVLAAALLLAGCELIVGFDPPPERGVQCDDGLDNDGDGKTDCDDDGCAAECLSRCGNGAVDPAVFGFAAPVRIPVAGGPTALATIPAGAAVDVLVLTATGLVRLANDAGTLTAGAPVLVTGGTVVASFGAGDLDGARRQDALLLVSGDGSQALPYLDDGTAYQPGRAVALRETPKAVVVGDFDGKSGADALVALASGAAYLANDGKGGFSSSPLQLPAAPTAMAVGDDDRDGDLDVVCASATTGQVFVLTNVGASTAPNPFLAGPALTVAAGVLAPTFADVDGAGPLEVLVLDGARVRVLKLNADHILAVATTVDLDATALSLVAADLDLDGKTDLAVGLSTGAIVVYHGDGKGAFTKLGTLAAGHPDGLVAATIDAQRGLDLVVVEREDNRVSVYRNTSTREECDDGNQVANDGCNPDCTIPR